ncbi:hypothetical protein KP509_13G069100 [Ceratopteris richardii]|uniref:DYW domain-containing protein n=1 Tax=Ceratopteris richardii TaxID=49495 RepID=A0A8T2TJT7_CERRI|nr:hypothetical protein KP509_13G069100 [Ceratopteris richardii]KAH7421648.1 hypothetical protein KP509_13G069100 [Ceratopteris richardii]
MLAFFFSFFSRIEVDEEEKALSNTKYEYIKMNLTTAVNSLKNNITEDEFFLNDILCELLQQCIDENNLQAGRVLQSIIAAVGLDSHAFLGGYILRMLTHFQKFKEVNDVFNRLVEPGVFTWGVIISANVKLGDNQRAIALYRCMLEAEVRPDGHVFVEVLKACMDRDTLSHTQQVHANIIEYGLEHDIFIGSSLVRLYVDLGTFQDVATTFCRLPTHNTVTWSTLMSGCILLNEGNKVPDIFKLMQQYGTEPDEGTMVCLIAAASDTEDTEQGRQVHNHILLCGLLINPYVGNALVDMYCKCSCIEDAHSVFDNLSTRDVVTWSSLISGYANHGCIQKAFHLLDQMKEEGVEPNEVTYMNILTACCLSQEGRFIHEYLILHGLVINVQVGTALLDMYIRCGCISDAFNIFASLSQRNKITWTTMISGLFEFGLFGDAFNLLDTMQDQDQETELSEACSLSFLKACSLQGRVEHAWQLHSKIICSGLSSLITVGNALINIYVTCESNEDACIMLQRMPDRDVVSWTTILGMYACNDSPPLEGIEIFEQMKHDGLQPNSITYGYVLKLMSRMSALDQARKIHASIVKGGSELMDIVVANALLDVYAKCGRLKDAFLTFQRLNKKSLSNWTSLLMGCAQEKNYLLALEVFKSMLSSGVEPDGVVFLCLLLSCKSVRDGCQLLKSMRDQYSIFITQEHQNAMLEILGHAGHLNEAEDLLECNPVGCNIIGWTSLLHSCKLHVNVIIAHRCFKNITKVDPKVSAAYVLMSSVYAHAGMIHSAEELEATRKQHIGCKKPGHAFIEVDNRVHEFVVGDTFHPKSFDIYAKLEALNQEMKKGGYRIRSDLVLGAIPTDMKEESLCGHSEKLAIAFGLINLPDGATIRVSKNLRMCGDCHNMSKFISKVEKREIYVSDTYVTHHFQNGFCSCDDYTYQIFKHDLFYR